MVLKVRKFEIYIFKSCCLLLFLSYYIFKIKIEVYAVNAGKYPTPYFMTHFNDRTSISSANEKQCLCQSLDRSFIDID